MTSRSNQPWNLLAGLHRCKPWLAAIFHPKPSVVLSHGLSRLASHKDRKPAVSYSKPRLGGLNKVTSHYDSVLINRLRIGHCHLTHYYLLSGDDRPTCTFCALPLSVKHILLDCTNLWDICEKYFIISSVNELFQSTDNQTIIDFIKEIHFYY